MEPMLSAYWKSCPDGDNERRMKYLICYVYDGDDDGFVAEEDCDDLDSLSFNDRDDDGVNSRDLDCDDFNANIQDDCDQDEQLEN